ncbi:phosphatidylglycerophosphatase A family protein [Pseudaestuariivita atlantica]|uniref:Phosphatidylglycerophosphatase A n=1 Tax=Pseudaestuariivita atlantica TaxID=1317121 RepID=A0A0L1JMV9_9RHOB|nr:phosphatidylglycerophosphatase A [Pseudaestuariivita atlantica]KNG93042.1 phosphatidylglycerophosphatase [Pseudaestuariivita atlantica]
MIAQVICTFGGVGHLRPASGTWGSLAALAAAWVIATLTGFWGLVFWTVVVVFAGLGAILSYAEPGADVDRSEIVIDEVAGQWIALLPVVYGANAAGAPLLALWPGWVAAFVLFRLFDIVKIGPVGWADRRKDAVGVMLDDVIAGLFAAIGVLALAALAHGLA